MSFKKILINTIICTLIVLTLFGCQQSRIKGIREKGKLEEEPLLKVKLPDGKEKQLKLEEYITGVVAGEMDNNWPKSAYGAQAILARTFALKYLEENNTNVISSSFEHAQEYQPQKITDIIRQAAKETRGQVAIYKNEYIKGWFHASAGGQTTSAKVGLAFEDKEPAYVKSVKSPDNMAPDDIKSWQVSFTGTELKNNLAKMGKNIGELRNLEVDDRDKTGRVINFKFTGSKDTVKVKAANFRKELDPKKLKSIKIKKLTKNNNKYNFAGSGFGHGVGMSQWGAYAMAKNNKSPSEIVKYYYNNIDIVEIYD